MARLLGSHHDNENKDEDKDLCADLRPIADCPKPVAKVIHHKPKDFIRVGHISIDCSVVSFKTPGQARNVVSCPVSQTVTVPVKQTTCVEVKTGFGSLLVPVTETCPVPVTTTVNLPPVLTPVLNLKQFCPCPCPCDC